MTDALTWIDEELAGLQLGDQRLHQRQATLLGALSEQSQASIPTACCGWDEIKGAYRFFAHPAVTLPTVLAPHIAATHRRIGAVPCVILAQDTTELDFTGTRVAEHLGPLNYAKRVGWLAHCSVAFTPERVCLGLVGLELWTRGALEPALPTDLPPAPVPFAEKESFRWLTGYRIACQAAARSPQTQVVSVADREGDIYEVLQEAAQALVAPETPDPAEAPAVRAEWIIRACYDRCLPDKDPADARRHAKLWARVAEAPVLGEVSYALPTKGGRPGRRVTQTVRAAVVPLKPPARVGEKLRPLTLHAVLVREEAPPDGVPAQEWLLLTSLPVTTWEEVHRVIDGYVCRWQIECFFKVLKSGCRVEKLQLELPERVLPCLGLYLIVTWRILYLTMLGRACPALPCTVVFGDAEWKAIVTIVTKQPAPATPPSLAEMVRLVAMQGSYVGRAGDGHPGAVSLWVGLQRVMDYARAWEAFGPESGTYG